MQPNVNFKVNGEFNLNIDFANKKFRVVSKTEAVIFYNV